MNEVLKIGILWCLISVPMVYLLNPEFYRSFFVGIIGIFLTIFGFVIDEYKKWKWEKNPSL